MKKTVEEVISLYNEEVEVKNHKVKAHYVNFPTRNHKRGDKSPVLDDMNLNIKSDEKLLKLMLKNLFSNCIEHTSKSGLIEILVEYIPR